MFRPSMASAYMAAMATFAFLAAREAQAAFFVYHPAMCVIDTSSGSGTPTFASGGVLENNSSGTVNYFCPVPDDSSVPFKSATTAHLFGWANGFTGTSSGTIFGCRTYAAGSGGTCDGGHTFGATGSGNVNVTWTPGASWTGGSSSDSGYMYVELDGTNGNGGNQVFGYDFTF